MTFTNAILNGIIFVTDDSMKDDSVIFGHDNYWTTNHVCMRLAKSINDYKQHKVAECIRIVCNSDVKGLLTEFVDELMSQP